MELTIAVHREDQGYWAQVTRSEDRYLEGVASDAWSLRELRDCLEEALQMVMDDATVTLVAPRFEVGFNQARLARGDSCGAPGPQRQ